MEKRKLNIKNAINLMAPHTWAASIIPVAAGSVFSFALLSKYNLLKSILLLTAVILMQSAANIFNDCYDYASGTDTPKNSSEAYDAVLVYSGADPADAKKLGLACLICAAIIGAYLVFDGGVILLLIGLLGLIAVLFYSGSENSFSYLPLGELISAFSMGILVPFAVSVSIAKAVDARILPLSIPFFFGIGLIMMSNNICDIQRDSAAQRRTLPILLGRVKAIIVYRITGLAWFLSTPILITVFFGVNVILLAAVVLSQALAFRPLFQLTLFPHDRDLVMKTIMFVNAFAAFIYLGAILLSKVSI